MRGGTGDYPPPPMERSSAIVYILKWYLQYLVFVTQYSITRLVGQNTVYNNYLSSV